MIAPGRRRPLQGREPPPGLLAPRMVDTPAGPRAFCLNSTIRPKRDAEALILGFHGGAGEAQRFADRSGLADGFAALGQNVVFPQAEPHWSDGRPALEKNWEGDKALVQALLARHGEAMGTDRPVWAAAGGSNGGMFSLRLACEMDPPPRAVAAIVAAMPEAYASRAPKGPPVPLLIVQATEDKFIPWAGGEVPQVPGISVPGRLLGADDTIAFWLERNRCTSTPRRLDAAIGQIGVEIYAWDGGSEGADLWRVVLRGAGHRLLDRDPGAKLTGSLEELIARFVTWHLDPGLLTAPAH
ncbi:alpha/beta hydrolase family esterase [Pseudoroseicyclus sp. H15]